MTWLKHYCATCDWLLRKAWSLRLAIIAGVLTAAEVLIGQGVQVPGSESIPGWARALVITTLICAAFVFRLLAQRSIRRGEDEDKARNKPDNNDQQWDD
jgi:hypothetical protein